MESSLLSTTENRREPRFPLRTMTFVSGFDRAGCAFLEQVHTLDVSQGGIRLTGLTSEVTAGSILCVQQAKRRSRFQVLWVGDPDSDLAGQAGLQCVEFGIHTRKRILYIQPDIGEQALRRSYLETAGYEVVCRPDSREGVKAFEDEAFDLLLIDYPWTTNGSVEILAFVRLNSPGTRIVLQTGPAGPVPESLLKIADAFLRKSDSRHELLNAVEEMIGLGNEVRWPLLRLAARYSVEVPICVSVYRSTVPINIEGKTIDLSELGLGAHLTQDLLPGELVSLRFRLPGSDHDLTPRATVRRRLGWNYGFEFVSIDRRQLEEIRSCCGILPRVSLPQPT